MTPTPLSSSEVHHVWQQVCADLQLQLSPAVFNTWILSNPATDIFLTGEQDALVTITSPTAFHATNLQKNLYQQLKTSLDRVLMRSSQIEFKIGTITQTPSAPQFPLQHTLNQRAEHHATPPRHTPHSPRVMSGTTPQSPRVEDLFSESTLQAVAVDRVEQTARRLGLRTDYTFETFAVSTSNEMAHAAATAVSNRPGQAYNPLFLYGGVGVGKTHLMHAIGNNILRNNPDVQIIYCTGEEFTNEIVNAIQTKKALRFKEKFRTAQVLLIDDVQFIAGKNAVQEEFFHTFNALTQQQSQIVLTSDRPPHEINLLEDRLRSRFEAGLMIDIQQPSFELRTAILLIKSSALNVTIPIDLAKQVAAQVDSARKIEGFITSIRLEVELKKRSITPELITEILATEANTQRQQLKVTPADVLRAVANHYHLKQTAIKGKRRVQKLVQARHIAMYLLKEELDLPYVEIGRWFSNRDHTSVLHAVKKIDEQLNHDDDVRQDISALRMSLTAISH